MLPEMTAQEIATEIGLRQIHGRIYGEGETFVMVEGKTDELLWEEFRAKDDCTLYPAKGKDKIIAALEVAKKREMRGIAGIVDADYWLVTNAEELGTENLLYDDCCPDMESILLHSPALRKVLRHSINADEIEQLHAFADTLKIEAQRLATELGYFRLLNHLNDYGLRCNSIRFAEVIDRDTLELDRDLVASKLAGDLAGITSEDLLRQVAELREQYPPGNAQLCRGKDVVGIMAFILPILFKSEFGNDLSAAMTAPVQDKGLSKYLRIAYEFGYFKETSLFDCICKWEDDNKPYRIIRDFSAERTPA
ncbi:MAG: DUF4435 domain-containing protein [Chloroflexota bacterium]|nr:DUF4435 domain-containing protein [Chloroflexota bacterium]